MAFDEVISIAGKPIGHNNPVYIIAEAGVAHFGDLGKALALVDLAAECGADALKTQAYTTDSLISPRLNEWRQRLSSREISFDFLAKMKERCDTHGITFLCTAHDASVVPWLLELNVPAFKIGSGERGNLQFISELSSYGLPIILSTGMYEEGHLMDALTTIRETGLGKLAVLHCVTSYPTPMNQLNIRAMDRIGELFTGPVGYSDHTFGVQAAVCAVANGASIIEKHIALDFNIPNAQDWKVSCGPHDLADFVNTIRNTEIMMGSPTLKVQECEKEALHWALKSLVASKRLEAGHYLQHSDLVAMRPGDGMSPDKKQELIGMRLSRSMNEGELIRWENLEK